MTEPDIPKNEPARLRALERCDILYSPAEERFDRITRLACRTLDVPIALVSVVGDNIQWFKSQQGMNSSETSRKVSFCAHAILKDETFVVNDAGKHPDFFDNPLVTGNPFIRFYAGQPLKFGANNLGTLCIIDTKPRELSNLDMDTLRSLAKWAELELKMNLYRRSQKDLIRKLDASERKSLLEPALGVWNQNGIDTLLDREVRLDKAKRKNLTLVLIALNELPRGRDKHSKTIREGLLLNAFKAVRMLVNPQDILGITDKDELLILCEEQDSNTGYRLPQMALSAITGDTVLIDGHPASTSANIGIVTNKTSSLKDTGEFINRAREALKFSCKRGSNRIYYAIAGGKGGYFLND